MYQQHQTSYSERQIERPLLERRIRNKCYTSTVSDSTNTLAFSLLEINNRLERKSPLSGFSGYTASSTSWMAFLVLTDPKIVWVSITLIHTLGGRPEAG
ncbi:unnamed protein product [Adineta ricciae]|uniref:Uncharacterized protein n=1 Tax=Adineta ricciae TaxID=249248 RepID=A0A813WJP0_ADIRI|nr:unnamed protein product [Adineta ricciae]